MTVPLLYRIASVLLALFAVVHTIGMFRRRSGTPMEGVVRIMRKTRFRIMGFDRTMWDFYAGFGLTVTAYLGFAAVVAWLLGDLTEGSPDAARSLRLAFALVQIAVAVLSWGWFFIPPGVVSTVIALLLVLAAAR